MAIIYNYTMIGGNLTSAVELRQTPNGTSVARATVAVDRRRTDAGDKADFIECVFWRQSAEYISRYAKKGDNVVVVGELRNESWEDGQGRRRTKLLIYATGVMLAGRGSGENKRSGDIEARTENGHSGFDGDALSVDDDLPF